jgi:glycosyltransferase involved in cell wall biosynthesis
MACGTPVIASHAAAIPEICQSAALFFDPQQPEDIAEKILSVLKDQDLREDLVKRGVKRIAEFSWDSTARQTLSVYRSLVGVP